jgi:hypothetical protein
MADQKRSRPAGYTIGRGRPPKETQFKPGKSGNPKGRPKGSRPVGAVLQDIIRQKVTVTEGGKTRRISALEVMLRRLTNDAMRGDQNAIKLFLSLVDRYGEAPETTLQFRQMLAEDQAILREYLRERSEPVADAPATAAEEGDGHDV